MSSFNELSYQDANRIKKWRCEDKKNLEEIAEAFYNFRGDDNGFLPRRTKEEIYLNYFSPIVGWDLLVTSQFMLNESRNSNDWNLSDIDND